MYIINVCASILNHIYVSLTSNKERKKKSFILILLVVDPSSDSNFMDYTFE